MSEIQVMIHPEAKLLSSFKIVKQDKVCGFKIPKTLVEKAENKHFQLPQRKICEEERGNGVQANSKCPKEILLDLKAPE